MAPRKTKTNDTEPQVQLLTTSKCLSLRGSEVRYSIGILGDTDIYIKLVSSSGGGQINNSWIPFAEILKLLENYTAGGSFTSRVFDPLFPDVSSNNCGFTLAVAVKEKMVKPQEGKRTKFAYDSPIAFLAKVEKLIANKASKTSTRRKAKATA